MKLHTTIFSITFCSLRSFYKKPNYMKSFFFCFVLLTSCTSKPKDLSKLAAGEIRKADIAMNDMAVKEGFHKTLLLFADDSLIKPQDGEFPVIGKTALEKYWSAKKETHGISWQPFKAEAAQSGDLGYTLGNWTFAAGDTTYNGNYYTIWKKQPDGKWKFVFDGGNNTPAPAK